MLNVKKSNMTLFFQNGAKIFFKPISQSWVMARGQKTHVCLSYLFLNLHHQEITSDL